MLINIRVTTTWHHWHSHLHHWAGQSSSRRKMPTSCTSRTLMLWSWQYISAVAECQRSWSMVGEVSTSCMDTLYIELRTLPSLPERWSSQSLLYKFDRSEAHSPGTVEFLVRADPYNVATEFCILDVESSYNAILRRRRFTWWELFRPPIINFWSTPHYQK